MVFAAGSHGGFQCEKRKLPFDEEHKLSVSVRGADDALRLEVSMGVGVLVIWLEVTLLVRLHAGLQKEQPSRRCFVLNCTCTLQKLGKLTAF